MVARDNNNKSQSNVSYVAFLLAMLGLLSPAHLFPQDPKRKSARREETPNERFNRKGGRDIQAKVVTGNEGELTMQGIADQRDLDLYDQTAHFDLRHWSTAALNDPLYHRKVEVLTEKAREFIWEHWQSKKRGYLRFTGNSVDATGTSHLFIEPDDKGGWQIVWRIARAHALAGNSVTYLPIIRSVEKKIGSNGKTILKFKDADGEDMNSF